MHILQRRAKLRVPDREVLSDREEIQLGLVEEGLRLAEEGARGGDEEIDPGVMIIMILSTDPFHW